MPRFCVLVDFAGNVGADSGTKLPVAVALDILARDSGDYNRADS